MKMLEDVRVCLSRVEESQATTTGCSSKSQKQQQRLASRANNGAQTGSVKQAVEEILDVLELATAEGQPMQIDSSRVSSELSNLQALLVHWAPNRQGMLLARIGARAAIPPSLGCQNVQP